MTSPKNWTDRRLGEVCTLRGGSAFSQSLQGRDTGDIPFIKQSDMSLAANSLYILEANNWVSKADLLELRAHPLPAMSVVFGKIGEGLKRNRYRVLTRPTLIDNNMMGAVPNSLVDQRFFAIVMSQIDMGSLSEGSALPYLRAEDVGNVRVLLPPLAEQRVIAGVLGALDDKIESNRRIIENALAIIVLELQLAEDEEWIEMGVSEIADFVNGGAFTKDASGTGRMVIRIAELNSGPGASTVYNEIEVPDEKTARVGDILMAWSGSLGVHYWTRAEAIINQHIFKVVCTNFPSWFVYDRLCRAMPEFKQTAADKATTMGHIKRHHLDDTKVVVPAPEVLQTLNQELGPIWDRVMSAEIENHSLVALRNAFLPELLSGRLRLKDAESIVENV